MKFSITAFTSWYIIIYKSDLRNIYFYSYLELISLVIKKKKEFRLNYERNFIFFEQYLVTSFHLILQKLDELKCKILLYSTDLSPYSHIFHFNNFPYNHIFLFNKQIDISDIQVLIIAEIKKKINVILFFQSIKLFNFFKK